ncbi:MAG: RNA 2'-phosphotransferase [Anaerolineae bacterium]
MQPTGGSTGLSSRQRTRLSKFMSLILRHRPEEFGLTLDREGFVGLADLARAIASAEGWSWVTQEHIREVAETCPKGRFEIRGGRIQARYGHSIPLEIPYPAVTPPQVLYHGTPRQAVARILREGLRPMGRQYVHLSTSREGAIQVGRRRDPSPVVLRIRAREAMEQEVVFFQGTAEIYLARQIPPQFIEVEG